MALYSNEIEDIVKEDKDASLYFKGVYAADKIQTFNDYPYGIIVNLDDSSQPGSHWIAIWVNDKNRATYFDSYGLPPIVGNIEVFMSNYNWDYNKKPFQHANSQDCGYYAILFILMCSKRYKLEDMQFLFFQKTKPISTNRSDKKLAKVNDTLVKDYVKYFHTSIKTSH